LHDVFPRGQLVFRYVRLKPKTELATWVRHLALQMAPDAPRTTVVGGRSLEGRGVELRVFEPLDETEARHHLATLVGLYHMGQKAPLCLFPNASKQFVSKWLDAAGKPDRETLALLEAKRTFSPKGRRDARGPEPEREDAYVRRLFDSVDPFSAAAPFDEDGSLGLPNFATLSRTVFEPLLMHSRVESQ
jgi:exonuclease V gamma subunit